ncbi:MAG: hypothetical protein AAFZ52_17775 [Bacteroidota bacterium]
MDGKHGKIWLVEEIDERLQRLRLRQVTEEQERQAAPGHGGYEFSVLPFSAPAAAP